MGKRDGAFQGHTDHENTYVLGRLRQHGIVSPAAATIFSETCHLSR